MLLEIGAPAQIEQDRPLGILVSDGDEFGAEFLCPVRALHVAAQNLDEDNAIDLTHANVLELVADGHRRALSGVRSGSRAKVIQE